MSGDIARLTAALAGRYTIERELGQGGMATVYLAHDVKHDRQVAIKVLHEYLGASLGAERFLAEIKTTAKLQHPHILPLIDSGSTATGAEPGGLLYYVMPYVVGESLRQRLDREKQLPIDDAVRIAREVADALGHAHGHNIVHRDIKPENILLQSGHALVADFGVALAVTSAAGPRITATGVSVGTPHYMSPEQAAGGRDVDHRSDIYSLGVVLYEALAGEPPFAAATAQGVIARVISEEPREVRSTRHTVPAAVASAVARSLQKLPADRWSTAAEFAAALQGAGEPEHVRRAAAAAQPWYITALVGVTALVLGVLGARLARAPDGGTSAAGGGARFWTIALPDSAPFSTAADDVAGVGSALAASADGRMVVYVGGRGGGTRLHLFYTDRRSAVGLPGTEGARLPVFSPDGRWVAFVAGGELRKVDVSGLSVVRLAPLENPTGLFWLSNDELLVSQQAIGPARISAAGGSIRPLGDHFLSISVVHTQLLPGGEHMLGATAYGELATVSMRTGALRFITAGDSGQRTRAEFGQALRGRSPRYLPSGHLVYASGSSLMAVPFDSRSLQATGKPVPLADDLRAEGGTSEPQFALGDDGTLVYAPGRDGSVGRLVWIQPGVARVDTLAVNEGSIMALRLSLDGRRLALVERLPSAPAAFRIVDLARGVEERARLDGEFIPETWDASGTRIFGSIVPDTSSSRACCFTGAVLDVPSLRVRPTSPLNGDVVFREFGETPGGLRCQNVTRGAQYVLVLRKHDDASQLRDLVLAFANDCAFSHDGRWVVFAFRDGLFVTGADLNQSSPSVKIAPDAREARWTPSGDAVVYRTGNRLMRVGIRVVGSALELGTPRLVDVGIAPTWDVLGTGWEMGPDGRILSLRLPSQPDGNRLSVVTRLPDLIAARLTRDRPAR